MHRHHKIAKSRGGTNEDWNLIEMDPYEHAYEHALDFVLFESAPIFDCRHDAWPLLPEDLKDAVRKELSSRMSVRIVSEETRRKTSRSLEGKNHSDETRQKMSITHTGKPLSNFHRKAIQKSLLGHSVSQKCRETAKRVSRENFQESNTKKFKCLVTGKISTAGPLTGYQKARGIDPSLREQIYD
jgi:hypothetical protein